MTDGLVTSITSQIPVVALFAYIMIRVVNMFLAAIKESEERQRGFIREQREAHLETEREMIKASAASLQSLTDRMCAEFDDLGRRMDYIINVEVGHDAFVRTSFKERFGPAVTAAAEQASKDAIIENGKMA